MYQVLYNAITDAEKLFSKAAFVLQTAQQQCEDIYVETDELGLSEICRESILQTEKIIIP